jgi:putative FmdB family regulatory protein
MADAAGRTAASLKKPTAILDNQRPHLILIELLIGLHAFSATRLTLFFRRFESMPIYEYECSKCGNIEEAIQKFSEKPLSKCRHCSGKLHKLISHSTFHLKGSGWYVTDYASKSQKSPSSPGKKGDTASTESKPSKKPADKTEGT